ncbi:hypothetical protein [Robertmurraya sp.]|uniref:hypothetical protein n=1 Tax=Robertmurraya sp. TaxID=2837525 RepID=UPI003703A4CD
MRLTEVSSYQDENGIQRVLVTRKDKGKTVSKTELIHGNRYRVEPLNPQKLKHRGRAGVLVGFVEGKLGPDQVKIKFEDTGRVGQVQLDDLVEA